MTAIPHIRTSERRSFKRCQMQWQWSYRNGLKSRTSKPDALWFGTGIHLALAERYKYPGLKRGTDVLKVWRDYVGDEIAMVRVDDPSEFLSSEPDWLDAGALGESMLGSYLDLYGRDERWHVISAEQSFEIPIPRPGKRNETLCLYNGTFDLVALDLMDEESLWIWDHKTARAIQTGHLALDDQAGSYYAVAGDVLAAQGLIKPGQKLVGILYNFLRKGKPDDRPTNAVGQALNKPTKAHYLQAFEEAGILVPGKITVAGLEQMAFDNAMVVGGDVSKVQPAALFLREEVFRTPSERKRQIEKIQAEALQMEAIRKRQLPLTKNPTPDCAFGCAFFQMCELHENGDDWQEFRDGAFKRLDPYLDHRKSTEA